MIRTQSTKIILVIMLILSPLPALGEVVEQQSSSTINSTLVTLLVVLSVLLIFVCGYLVMVNKRLKTKNSELFALNRSKDKFFSIIAHDLKSPFNSLLGFAEILTIHADSSSPQEIAYYSSMIQSTSRKLYLLIENLLVWSRAQIGTLPYKPEPLDVAVHTSNVVSLMRATAESKDVIINFEVGNDLLAYADSNHYDTILRNLLSNAIKYSKVGGVVSIGAVKESGKVKVWVSDNGEGLDKLRLKTLFEGDAKISEPGTFQEKGTGLGLMICKEFVDINKGAIWAESEQGKGAIFKFTLPLYLN